MFINGLKHNFIYNFYINNTFFTLFRHRIDVKRRKNDNMANSFQNTGLQGCHNLTNYKACMNDSGIKIDK